ncbi:hypothetical protein F4777DRAFT_106764 [Nemania sp. FL0916]|nr:hypothetical protein F4777DRAFT_106764 [Nemania sp. FL0916]
MASLYDLTIPFLTNALKAEQHLLEKAESFAAEKGITVDELLEARLAPDMWPLSQQIVISSLHATMCVLKITGTTPNKVDFGTASLENSKKFLSETLETLSKVKPEEINGQEAKIVKAQLGPNYEPEMTVLNYVTGYLQPNVYFHLAALYNILRTKGAAVGKKDYISTFIKLA